MTTQDPYEELRADLKRLRNRRNMTQAEVAKLLGVGLKVVNKFEAGLTQPRPAALQAIQDLVHEWKAEDTMASVGKNVPDAPRYRAHPSTADYIKEDSPTFEAQRPPFERVMATLDICLNEIQRPELAERMEALIQRERRERQQLTDTIAEITTQCRKIEELAGYWDAPTKPQKPPKGTFGKEPWDD